MKRLLIIAFIMLLVLSIVSCSKETSNQKREEELNVDTNVESNTDKQENENKSDKDSIKDNEQEEKIVYASDLKEGDSIDGYNINTFIYKEGEEFGIGLDGEITVSGEISYDNEYWEDIVLSIDEESALPTTIKFKFDEEYSIVPPLGTFIIDNNNINNNLDVLENKIGNDLVTEIRNGKTLKVKLVVDKYAFYTENHSSPMFDIQIVDIVDFESDKDSNSDNEKNKKTVYASDLKEGDSIDGYNINTFIYKEGEEFGIGLDGEITVSGEISYDNEYWEDIVLSIDEESALPTTIKFKFDEEYSIVPPLGTFIIDNNNINNNLDVLENKIGSDLVNEIRNGKTLKVKLVVNNYAFYTENHSSPMFDIKIVDIVDFEVKNN